MPTYRSPIVSVLLFLAAFSAAASAQQTDAEVVRGVVRSLDGDEPIAGARVIVTGLRSFTRRITQTNARGGYTVLFGDPEGEYVVSVAAVGYAPMTGRASRTGGATFVAVDIVLPRVIVYLDSLTVIAGGPPADTSQAGAEQHDVLRGPLFSPDPSSVNTLMAQAPSVTAIPDFGRGAAGYSVLGAPPDQNGVILDGAGFGGQSLPPGVLESATIATTTYDAARGAFAGGQLSVKTRSGRDRFDGSLESKLADPRFAWIDPRAGQVVPQNINWNGAISGPIRRGSVYYNFGLSQSTENRDLVSLLSLSDAQRLQRGLAPDSLAALQQTLATQGIPVTTERIPDQNTSRNRSALLRIDVVPSATATVTLTGSADDVSHAGDGISPLGYPSLGSGNSSRNLRGQLSTSAYLGGFVDELSTTLQQTSSGSGPFVALPSGTVRLGTEYPGGTAGLTDLGFGGGTAARASNTTRSWEIQHQLSRLTSNNRHKFSVGQSLNLTATTSRDAAQAFGTFTYQTLDALAANRPASYSRTFSSIERSTTTTTSALWLKGESRVTPDRLHLEYGLRFDFIHSSTRPPYNPVVDSLFGRRTDQVPEPAGFSPRLGFSWIVKPPRPGGTSPAGAPLTVSGGVGAFRGVIPSERIASLVDATGLATSARQLTCIGDATPIPDWTTLAMDSTAVPVQCADGGVPVQFATDVPRLQLLNPAYRPPTSWRGNVKVEGLALAGWHLEVGGTYSYTRHGESAIDLNLRSTPAFTLVDEHDRPVFVLPADIVAGTGAIAPGASRLTDRFGEVTDYLADLESHAVQFVVQVNREHWLGKVPLSLSYTYNRGRQQERGFGGSTAGDPLVAEWARGPEATHQLRAQTAFNIPFALLSVDLVLSSGQPYTPMVVGDVNGDGQANDRAFIFNPATTSDLVLAQQLRALLATATPATRECLESQFGRIAGRNSCRTGWRFQPNLRFDFRLPGIPDPSVRQSTLGDRLRLSVTTSNAVSTLLYLLGLSNTSLNVLSNAAYPLDPNLLYLDGFDPDSQRFRYRINQQFGEGRPQRVHNSEVHYPGAFQVQLGARFQLGAIDRPRPMVQELGLVALNPQMPAPTEAEVRERLRRLTQNPVATLLAMRDSLLLTEEQIQRLEQQQALFVAKTDSIFAPVVAYIVTHGQKTKDKQVRKLISDAQRAMAPLLVETMRMVMAELKEVQKQRIPASLRSMTTVLEPPSLDWGSNV